MENEIIAVEEKEVDFDLGEFTKMCAFCKHGETQANSTICQAGLNCSKVPRFDSKESKDFICHEFDV